MDNEPELPPADLARLRQSPQPPPTLEGRVVGALRRERLLRRGPMMRVLSRVAAAALFITVGAVSGRYLWPQPAVPTQPAAGPQYLFLLAGDETPTPDGSSRAQEYGRWARDVYARGIGISGLELVAASSLVRGRSGGAFPELTAVGGFFLVDAANDEEALELARSSPHVKYGGSVVIKRVAGQ